MFRELSIFSKIMFGTVGALLLLTLVLGITTAVKAGKGEVNSPNTPTPSQLADVSGTPKPTGGIAGADVTPEPTPEPIKKYIIAIDPGQQKSQDKDLEPIGPGSSTTVEKMGYGDTSTTTKEREYIWTLRFAETIKAELEARDYEVVLVRTTNEESISNSERAQKANEADADLLISLQLDSSSTASVKGMYIQYATDQNPYVTEEAIAGAKAFGTLLHDKLIAKSGANDRGTKRTDKLAVINWAKMPAVVMTFGYASNKDEDALLQSEEYQQLLAGAMCDAIDAYLEK